MRKYQAGIKQKGSFIWSWHTSKGDRLRKQSIIRFAPFERQRWTGVHVGPEKK